MLVRYVSNRECAEVEGAAVVIDVLRAFSTAGYALAWGAKHLLLVETLDAALHWAGSIPNGLSMKDGPPEAGFDLVNSPGHLRFADLAGKVIVQKTTAGTVGALAARHADPLLCSSFVNAAATARFLQSAGATSVTFVITGAEGEAEEDRACADYIAALLVASTDVDVAPFLARAARSTARHELDAGLAAGYLGIHPDDVELCLTVDVVDQALVASARGDHLLLQGVAS